MKKYIWFSFLFLTLVSGCGKEAQKQKVEVRTIKVQTAPLQKQEFREIFRAQGMVEAARKGTISSFVPGKIDKIFFEEGSIAEAGKSLFQVDLTNLTNRVELAQKDLEVAKASRLSTQQGVKLAQIRLQKAERDFKRNQTLYSSRAVSADTFEQADTAYHSALVMLDVAVSLDRAATAKVQQAETALKLARQMLDDSHPAVPFRALILEKFKEESEFVGPGMPVVAVEDPTSREISCRISAIYWERLKPGTEIEVFFGEKKICRSSVYYRAEVIDPASRTFEIKAKLPADTSLKSGTLCDVEIILTRRIGWGVMADAVLSGGRGRMSVFVNQGGTAKEIDVRCGLTTGAVTEILSPEPLLGKAVIVRGQAFVREGDKLEVER